MPLLIPTDRPPITPGQMLVEEFLEPLGMTQTAFAERIGVTYPRLNEIVNGKRGITPDTALRFAKALGTTPDLWINLQTVVELYAAKYGKKAVDLDRIEPIHYARPLADLGDGKTIKGTTRGRARTTR